MDEVSVTRSPDPALAPMVADANLCAQVADALGIGEEVVLAMAEWTLSREWDEGFDAERVLLGWAKKRGRGAWSGRPFLANGNGDTSNGDLSKWEIAVEVARYWQQHPEELVAALDRTARSLNGEGDS